MHGVVEKFFRIGLHVPFSREIRGIACFLHPLRPSFFIRDGSSELAFFFALCLPNKTSRHQHGSAGDTNSAVPSAHVVGLAKYGARLVKRIEVRRVQVTSFGAPHLARSDGVDGLIIRDDEDNVWRGWSRLKRITES